MPQKNLSLEKPSAWPMLFRIDSAAAVGGSGDDGHGSGREGRSDSRMSRQRSSDEALSRVGCKEMQSHIEYPNALFHLQEKDLSPG
jgi:hypothetical protein